ncbi:MAG: hypothetical protein HZA50_10025 [Planctomycetes bacterium]|nr:hypothetical protein [Planctomycetota bacterium]
MNTTRKESKQTAAETYAQRRNDIAVLMDCIGMQLGVHAERAKADPKNYGFVGDLDHIRQTMKETLAFLMIGRNKFSEAEASRLIEDHIEEMRDQKD